MNLNAVWIKSTKIVANELTFYYLKFRIIIVQFIIVILQNCRVVDGFIIYDLTAWNGSWSLVSLDMFIYKH